MTSLIDEAHRTAGDLLGTKSDHQLLNLGSRALALAADARIRDLEQRLAALEARLCSKPPG